MLEKRADFKIGKSYTDDGSGKKAKKAPKTINEILEDDIKLKAKLPGKVSTLDDSKKSN
jgi:hypothetical protein